MPKELVDVSEILKQYECCLGNIETTIRIDEGQVYPGGTYASADLVCLRDLKTVGFNLLNTTNNSSMDYGHVGLLVTLS